MNLAWHSLVPACCHTRLHLGFSAKLRIWQVPACKMEPQNGVILWLGPPTAKLFFVNVVRCPHPNKVCVACGVPPSQYMLSFNVVRCPHPLCSTHQEDVCGVPPFQYKFFCAVSPPPCNSVPLPHLALSLILSKVENLESSSLQDEATNCFFYWVTWPQFDYQSSSTCISECGTPSWACLITFFQY